MEKELFKLINNGVFGKTMRKTTQRYQTVTNEARRNYLVSELNYHTAKIFP